MKKILLSFFMIFVMPVTVFALEKGPKNGLVLQTDDGNYSLKIGSLVQFQHQFLDVDGAGSTNGFQLRRVRLNFSGNAINPQLTYRLEFEVLSGVTNLVAEAFPHTGPNLRDGYLNYNFDNGIEIQWGQFKVPYSFDTLVSDSQNQFIDRTITDDVFGLERDLGINLHGRLAGGRFDTSLHLMNEGINRNTFNNNDGMLVGTRLVFNVRGDHRYTTGDPDFSETPNLAVGVAGNFNRAGNPPAADQSMIAATGDVAYRYRGLSALGAGYYLRNKTANTNIFGFLVQDGYFIVPKRFEVMARLGAVFPTAAGVTNGYEAGGGLGYYFKGHNLKLLTDYAILLNSPLVLGVGAAGTNAAANSATAGGAPGFIAGQNDHRVRTQVQLYF